MQFGCGTTCEKPEKVILNGKMAILGKKFKPVPQFTAECHSVVESAGFFYLLRSQLIVGFRHERHRH